MTKKTSFAVINRNGKTIEHTSRVPYESGQVYYKGKIYQLKNPLPEMKAKFIMLGSTWPMSDKWKSTPTRMKVKTPFKYSELSKEAKENVSFDYYKFIKSNKVVESLVVDKAKEMWFNKKDIKFSAMDFSEVLVYGKTNKVLTDFKNKSIRKIFKYNERYFKYDTFDKSGKFIENH